MKIRLKNPWYVNDTLYPVGDHSVSNDLYDKLPSSAEFVKDSIKEEEKKEDVFVSLKDLDVDRHGPIGEEAFKKGKK